MLGYMLDFEKSLTGQIIGRCPAFPDITVEASDEDAVRKLLQTAIEACLFSAFKKKKLIPLPVKVSKNRPAITFSVLVVSKIYLINTMIEKRIQKTEFARRLNCHMQQVDRLLDFSHASKIERVEEGLKVLGRGLELRPSDHVFDELSVQMLRKSG